MWHMSLDKTNKPNGWSLTPSPGYIEVSGEVRNLHEANPDYIWNGTTLVAPVVSGPVSEPPYVPQIVKMRQCQLYLYYNNLLDAVNQMVTGMSVPAQIEWETSDEVWRSSPLVELMRVQFGWSIEQTDQMFIDASTL